MATRHSRTRAGWARSLSFAPNPKTRIRVEPILGRWAVTVYRMPDCAILAEDYFATFELARARAEDFGRLLKDRELVS